MFNKKSESPKQLIRLASRPLLTDLQKWCQDVVRARDKSINVVWNNQDNTTSYNLIITSTPGGSDPNWRMTSQAGTMKKDLWFYISNDINNIFSMMVNALGEDLSSAIAADAKAVATTGSSATHSGISGMGGSGIGGGMSGMGGGAMSGMGGGGMSGMGGGGGMSGGGMSGMGGGGGMSGMGGGGGSGMGGGGGMFAHTGNHPSIAPLDPSGMNQQRSTGSVPIASPTETLTGNLAVLHITNLLQSISMGKMTGRLHIEPVTGPVEVFFEAGNPVHALSRTSSGEEAFLEVVALNNGSFIFEPNLKTDTRTINRTLDSLILKGIQILDCWGLIEGAGVTVNSIVHRSQQGLSEQEFEQKISEGAPLDLALQKRFYISIDGQASIKLLIEKHNLPRSEWIPLISNLVKVGLAKFTNAGPSIKKSIPVDAKRVDPVLVEQFAHTLKRADTGAFTYQSFMYFINQEFLRYKRTEAPMSIILIDIRCSKPGGPVTRNALSPQTVLSVVQNLNSLKRELDLVFQYEGQSLAILLPHCHAPEAATLARRAVTSIGEAKFMMGMERLNVSAVMGVASIPGDFETLGEVLAAAELAKERAANCPDGVQVFCEMS